LTVALITCLGIILFSIRAMQSSIRMVNIEKIHPCGAFSTALGRESKRRTADVPRLSPCASSQD
ncbi:hypothetical protein, partial [Pseudomonas syringae]|uniref:hypothetical protein n=1 Tax=Pseudomonas syringae TaxID=317 RepID=UPI001F1C193F